MLDTVLFAALGITLVMCAIQVVTSENLVHSVLFLALTLFTTAGLYLELQAGLMAGVQVLLYTGGVATLMIFAVMLTRHQKSNTVDHESAHHLRGAVIALGTFGLLCAFILRAPMGAPITGVGPAPAAIGKSFLVEFALPFEVLSVLLLAAMIGSIVIARKEDA